MPPRPTPYPHSELPSVVPGEVIDITSPQLYPAPEHRVPNQPDPGPSVAILSLRDVRPTGAVGSLREAEDVLRDTLAAGLYRVKLSSRYARLPWERPWLRRVMGASGLVRPYRIEHHQRDRAPADVLLVLAHDVPDASTLMGVPGWHLLGELVIMHIAVVTERDLRRFPRLVNHLRRKVDALFSGTEMPPLGHLRSDRLRTVAVIPPLLDVLAFPDRQAEKRSIDVFSPGPQSLNQHKLLHQWATRHNGTYQHDLDRHDTTTASPVERREAFSDTATRSRVFLANYAQYDNPRHTGAYREVGARFYEAMAAGCAVIGDLPSASRQFSEYVAAASPIHFPRDAQWLPADVAAVLDDPERSQQLGTLARATALRYNDVAHRWREMASLAGIPVSSGIEARIQHLAALADKLTDPPNESSAGRYRDPPFDRA